jgi:hypothetical protein
MSSQTTNANKVRKNQRKKRGESDGQEQLAQDEPEGDEDEAEVEF